MNEVFIAQRELMPGVWENLIEEFFTSEVDASKYAYRYHKMMGGKVDVRVRKLTLSKG
jgi:hypothetical protein